MADLIPPMIVTIEARVAQAEADLKKVTAQVDQFGKAAKSNTAHADGLSGSFKKMALAVGGLFALQKVTQLLGDSAKAAVEDNKSQALLERQIKATTSASDSQIAGTEAAIRTMSNHAAVMDDKIRPAMATLVRATGDLGQATSLTSLALDVSAGTGRSLESVAIALAKAHNGNTGALQRLGISLKGVSDPMAYLEKTFKGAAETAANTDPYQRLQVAMDHIKESIGTALLPILNKFATWLNEISPKIEQFFKDLNNPATETGAKWKVFLDILKGLFDWITKNSGVVIVLVGAFTSLKIVLGLVKLAQEAAAAAQWLLNIAMDANPVGAMILLIGGLATLYLLLANNADKATDAQKRAGSYIGRGGSNVGRVQAGPDYSKYSSDEEKRFAARKGQFAADYIAPSSSGSGGGGGGGATKTDPFITYLKDTQKKILDARKTYDKAVAEANDKYGKLIKQYSDEMTSLIQQSMDRLRSVFTTAASADIGAMFAAINKEGNATADDLLLQLQNKLAAGQKLATNAAELAGLGYSQTFIEQVVNQGTDTGNAMAEALKSATPETAKAIQDTFTATETLANTGMDTLAKQIYDKSGLATDELKRLYKTANDNMLAAQKDLQNALITAANALNTSLDTIEAAFTKKLESMASTASKYKNQIQGIYGSLASNSVTPTPFSYTPTYVGGSEIFTGATGTGTTISVTNNIDTGGAPVDPNAVTVSSIKFGLPYTLTGGGTKTTQVAV